MDDVRHLKYESASLILSGHPRKHNLYLLHNLYSKNPRQGHAKELMRQVMEVADRENIVLVLTARQYGNPHGMSTAQLEKFYESFGFVKNGATMMVRQPQNLHGV